MATESVSPIALCALMFSSPVLVLVLVLPLRAPDFGMSGPAWGWSLCGVLVAATIPIGCFYAGVRRVGAAVAGLLSTAEPVVTVVLAYLVLDESLTAVQLAGAALVVGSVAALSLQGRRPAPPPEVAFERSGR